LHTAGERRRLALTAERSVIHADGQDLAFVAVELVDDVGVRATDSDVEVELTIDGPAALQGFGSALPVTGSHSPTSTIACTTDAHWRSSDRRGRAA
jgi:beta-galactosidase